jgi:hypothetical protein
MDGSSVMQPMSMPAVAPARHSFNQARQAMLRSFQALCDDEYNRGDLAGEVTSTANAMGGLIDLATPAQV